MIYAVWESRYPIASTLVNFQKRLSLSHLLGLMQESAWVHAAHLGQGHRETHARGAAWVLVRQRVEMEQWPSWEQELVLRTWLRPPGAAMVVRDFEFFLDDHKVGQAAAHWITIDERHRRPVRLGFPDNPALFRQEGHLLIEPRKLAASSELALLERFQVRTSDLDLHGHVNNTRFADWILDSLPLSVHQENHLREYEINFLAEANPQETVEVHGTPWNALKPGDSIHFQGRRSLDGRSLFQARLQGERR